MFFPKDKRVQDRAMLDESHKARCIVCGRQGCDPAHVKSKGSGGDDVWWNRLHYCRVHHTEQHSKGHAYMMDKYPVVKRVMESMGWYINEFGKLRNKNDEK